MRSTTRRLERWSTGDVALDAILHGGLPRGLATLLVGPSGSGKSLLAHQLTRAAGPVAAYASTLPAPLAAQAVCCAEPRPRYLDLGRPLRAEGGAAAARMLLAAVGESPDLLVVDSAEWLSAADWSEVLAAVWERELVLVATARATSPELLDAAALVLALETPAHGLPRRLRVVKHLGAEAAPDDHPLRLGPLGIRLDAGASGALTVATAPVSALGARILSAFRTARSATAAELAALLGHGLETVETTLDTLAVSGYLVADTDQQGQSVYRLVR
jgi:circadian clock protein KaiC